MRKLYIVPCHSYHSYEIWRCKEVGDTLKLSLGVTIQATVGGNFYEERGSHCVIVLR